MHTLVPGNWSNTTVQDTLATQGDKLKQAATANHANAATLTSDS
jgi:hypothetical protein